MVGWAMYPALATAKTHDAMNYEEFHKLDLLCEVTFEASKKLHTQLTNLYILIELFMFSNTRNEH